MGVTNVESARHANFVAGIPERFNNRKIRTGRQKSRGWYPPPPPWAFSVGEIPWASAGWIIEYRQCRSGIDTRLNYCSNYLCKVYLSVVDGLVICVQHIFDIYRVIGTGPKVYILSYLLCSTIVVLAKRSRPNLIHTHTQWSNCHMVRWGVEQGFLSV